MPRLYSTATRKAEVEQAIERLHEQITPGDTIYTILKRVSPSGMYRHISAYKLNITERGQDLTVEPQWLAYNIAKALDWPFKKDTEAVGVSGVGMDMGFHMVYELSAVLWPSGYECPGERCRSSDHSNGDRNYTPHHHNNGGYALRQEWL